MGILTPYLSPEEIERVVELAGSVGWRWSEGFTYEGQKYGGEADEDFGADGWRTTILPPFSTYW